MHFRAGLPVVVEIVAVGTESPLDFEERKALIRNTSRLTLDKNLKFQARLDTS